jgi:FAD/FMN-containing dehydrogenase
VKLYNWSRSLSCTSTVFQPEGVEDLLSILDLARKHGKSIALKGAGYSYSDQYLNDGDYVADLTRMNRIKRWDPATGQMTVEPGVTVEQALLCCLSDGWVLPVVPGSRYPTMGGCVSNNVHGKNGFRQGNFGECVREVSLLTAEGRLLVCSPWGHGELFRAVVGGMGLLGVLVEITLQLARLPHPALRIRKFTAPGIHELVASLENVKVQNDLAIGQVDAFARGGGRRARDNSLRDVRRRQRLAWLR